MTGKFRILVFIFILMASISACTKENINDSVQYDPKIVDTLYNIAYGNDAQQKIDIYLPANRSSAATKVFVLVHGGGWSAGDKNDMKDIFNTLIYLYPQIGVVNINYRLATNNSPGNTMQIDDIKSAISHIQSPAYNLGKQYFFLGSSAGGHLSMLYGYGYDPNNQVKGICNIVGPADFTDPAYTDNIILLNVLKSFTGTIDYINQGQVFNEASPVSFIKSTSPPTISFFGASDPLIPISQKDRLTAALNAKGVSNEAYVYEGGHGDWSQLSYYDLINKLTVFIALHF